MTLRVKLAIVLAALAACAVAAVGYLSFNVTRDRQLGEIDSSLSAANRFDNEPDGRGIPGRGGGNAPDRPGNTLYVLQLLSADGSIATPLSGIVLPVDGVDQEIASGRRPSITRTVTAQDDIQYRVRTLPSRQGGALQIGRDLSEMNRVLHDLREQLLLIGAIVVAVAALAGWFLARQLTGGLRSLALAAKEVSTTGRLDVAVSTGGRDEVGQMGAAFSSMLATLGKSREDQRRLVQDAGHELRTPLTSVRTNVDVLRKHTNMAAEMRTRVLDDLDSEVAELTSLVEEVVAVASGASADEQRQTVRVGDVVDAAADRVRRRTSRQIIVTSDDSTAEMQRSLVERAVTNLLDNAAKFDATNQPIEIENMRGRITVRDHGPGIAEDDLDKVFDRFYRAVESRSLPGSGLGLSIVTEVALAHGGSTFAQNHPSGGAMVGFQIPATLAQTLTEFTPIPVVSHT